MVSAQQIFKELESKKWRPFYLIVGEEPFQAGEVISKLKQFFLGGTTEVNFCFDAFDGEGLSGQPLLESLQTLPGLFDTADAIRLVQCTRIDKLSNASFDLLESYFKDPSPTTCFLMTAAKVDRRKAWVREVESKGALLEVDEPYERDWPKWRGYMERKVGKLLSEEAWGRLVESAGGSLALAWAEVAKAALFVGDSNSISLSDVCALSSGGGNADVFQFTGDVVCRRAFAAMEKYESLLRAGENEVKLLALLTRHFRQLEGCLEAARRGITDAKAVATQIGVPAFFVPKIQGQARSHTLEGLKDVTHLLSEADFYLKKGEGTLFEHFLVPYFRTA